MKRKLNQIEKLNTDRDSKQQIVVPKLRPKSTRDRDIISQIYNYNLAVQIVLKDRDNLNQIYNYNPKDRDINNSKVIPTNFKIVVPNLKDRDNLNQIYNYKLTSSVGLDVKKIFYQIIKKIPQKTFPKPPREPNFLCL